jgi:hypothetical protein
MKYSFGKIKKQKLPHFPGRKGAMQSAKPSESFSTEWTIAPAIFKTAGDALCHVSNNASTNWLMNVADFKSYDARSAFACVRDELGPRNVRSKTLVPKKKSVHWVLFHQATGTFVAVGAVYDGLRVWTSCGNAGVAPPMVKIAIDTLIADITKPQTDCVANRTRRNTKM